MDHECSQAVQGFLNSTSEDEQARHIAVIADALGTRKLDLSLLVKSLGEHLTSTDEISRGKSTRLLAMAIDSWETKNPSANPFLVQFFSDRLEDYACVPEVLLGIRAVLRKGVQKEHMTKICRSILNEVHTQSLPQSARCTAFEIILEILNTAPDAVLELKQDLVSGVIQAVDGERDPRNLMHTFDLVVAVVRLCPEHLQYLEDLFEVFSCYFPVTFRPRANDPDSITREDLVGKLTHCFGSSSEFAKFCFPFLLDKAGAILPEAKIDSVAMIAECCMRYSRVRLQGHLETILVHLRAEVLTNNNADVVAACLKALSALAGALTAPPRPPGDLPPGDAHNQAALAETEEVCAALREEVGTFLVEQVLPQVLQPSITIGRQCVLLLDACLPASLPWATRLANELIPQIIARVGESTAGQAGQADQGKHEWRLYIVQCLQKIMEACHASFTRHSSAACAHPLQDHSDVIFKTLFAKMPAEATAADVYALSLLASLPVTRDSAVPAWLLPSQQIADLLSVLALVGSGKHCDPLVVSASQQALHKLSFVHSSLVCELNIPTLVKAVEARDSGTPASLGTLALLATTVPTFCTISETLVRLAVASIPSARCDSSCSSAVFSVQVLTCLQDITSTFLDMNRGDAQVQQSAVRSCRALLGCTVRKSADPSVQAWSEAITSRVLTVLRLCLASIPDRECAAIMGDIVGLLLHGDVAPFAELVCSDKAVHTSSSLVVLLSSLAMARTAEHLQAVVPLLSQCATGQYPSLAWTDEQLEHLRTDSYECVHAGTLAHTACKAAGALLNKLDPSGTDAVSSSLPLQIEHGVASVPAAVLVVWALKGLAMRAAPLGYTLLPQVCSVIARADGPVAHALASGMGTVLADDPSFVLHVRTHARLKPLFHQRFLTTALACLQSTCAPDAPSPLAVSAATGMLAHVPGTVIQGCTAQLLPLLSQGLCVDMCRVDPDASARVLNILADLAATTPDFVSSHLYTFVPLCLPLVHPPHPVQVRLAAVELLAALAGLPFHLVFPHKRDITGALQGALDDSKRVVRQRAVRANNTWHMLKRA